MAVAATLLVYCLKDKRSQDYISINGANVLTKKI